MEIETKLLGDETPNQNQKPFLLEKAGRGRGRDAKNWKVFGFGRE
jgi:hypothetical protein